MTCFKPFRALRPRADLAQLALCPPYDVVTRREAEEIAAKSPFSFMHVIRAEADLPGENPYSEAVYRRGAANLKKLEKERYLCIRMESNSHSGFRLVRMKEYLIFNIVRWLKDSMFHSAIILTE